MEHNENNQTQNESPALAAELDTPHYCIQCGNDMGYEWILGPICGKCVRRNHRRVLGIRDKTAPRRAV